MTTSRRRFLMQSGQAAAAAFASTWISLRAAANPLGKPVGIQLWTFNGLMQADAAGTLKKLRKIGYGMVESAGFGKLTAKQFRQLLDDAGLLCPSAHLSFNPDDLGAALDDANALGATYATSGSLDALVKVANPATALAKQAMSLEEAKQTAELANRFGAAAKRAGLQYVYHNHAREFADLGGGAIGYDILLRETNPEMVKFEIDCGWMIFAGHDPIAYFKKYPNRFPLIHVKDFLPNSDRATGAMLGAELGHGVVDYKPIFAAAANAGLKYYFVEQEGPFARMDPLQAAQVDYDYLHSQD